MDVGQIIIALGSIMAGAMTVNTFVRMYYQSKKEAIASKEVKHDCTRSSELEGNRVRIDQLVSDLKAAQLDIRTIFQRLDQSKDLYHEVDKAVAIVIEKLERENQKEKNHEKEHY